MLRFLLVLTILVASAATNSNFDQDKDWSKAMAIYDFKAVDIKGNEVSLNRYRGHVAIIVNVASNCGLTDTNYKELVELYNKYKDSKGLRILAFPSNEFNGQEPGTSQEIEKFVKDKYGVTFDMFEKVQVNGKEAHPLWKWLKSRQGGFITDSIKWNFTKFLVDKNGNVVNRYAPTTDPIKMEDDIKKLF